MRGHARVIHGTLLLAGCALALAVVIDSGFGQEKPAIETQRAQYLAQMKELAEATEVVSRDDESQPKLIATPVFRYDDQPRRFLDATMWVWTDGVRPVAFEKVEAMVHRQTGEPQWGYCFTSVSENLLSVTWSAQRRFESKEPGVAFQVVADAPAVAERDTAIKRQARELVRGFSARAVLDPSRNDTQELRLLPTPIFEYTDPRTGRFLGSVFGFSTNGTNPDLLILFEVRKNKQKTEWHFAPARMTSGGVTLTFRDKKVWETPFVRWQEAPFATWTFFQTHRIPLADEKS